MAAFVLFKNIVGKQAYGYSTQVTYLLFPTALNLSITCLELSRFLKFSDKICSRSRTFPDFFFFLSEREI